MMGASELTSGPAGAGTIPVIPGWIREIVPFGIWTTDRDLRITSWNEWLTNHSGLQASDVLGKPLQDIVPMSAVGSTRERFDRALAGEVSVLAAALHKYLIPLPSTAPESTFPHMLQTVRIAPLLEGEKIVGTITVIEDVSQREFQAAILHRQQEFDRLLSSSLAKLLQTSDPSREMSGIFASVRVAMGLDCFASYLLDFPGQRLCLKASLGFTPNQREFISSFSLSPTDYRVLAGAGSPLFEDVAGHRTALATLGVRGQYSFPLAVGERLLGLVIFGTYQSQSISLADQKILSRIAGYVAIALDRTRREHETIAASRAKDEFLAALSHELRTPLNPVLLLASDSAGNPNFSPEAREAFGIIAKNAQLEARLIDDLLDLTKISHGKMTMDKQIIDLHATIRDAVATVHSELAENNLSLEIDLRSPLHHVSGDPARLQQVFWNVLRNAIKFTRPGGKITISSAINPAQDVTSISVTDTGIGMDASELDRIFDAFAQGVHTVNGRAHRFGGLGLGLAISRKLVEMHSGTIEAFSPGKGRGSRFTISLPLVQEPTAPHPHAKAGVATGPNPEDTAVTRILLVEDHEPTRVTLKRLLIRRGYPVVDAESVETALAAAAESRFALVLSDIGLPDGDGYMLMRKLSEAYGLKGIALTGYGMEEDHAKSAAAGFIAHLTKPVSVSVLERALDEAFHRQ